MAVLSEKQTRKLNQISRPSSGEILEVWIRVWLSSSSLWSLRIPSGPSCHACANIQPYLKHLTLKQSYCCFLFFALVIVPMKQKQQQLLKRTEKFPCIRPQFPWVSKVSPVTSDPNDMKVVLPRTGRMKPTYQQEQIFPLGYMPWVWEIPTEAGPSASVRDSPAAICEAWESQGWEASLWWLRQIDSWESSGREGSS